MDRSTDVSLIVLLCVEASTLAALAARTARQVSLISTWFCPKFCTSLSAGIVGHRGSATLSIQLRARVRRVAQLLQLVSSIRDWTNHFDRSGSVSIGVSRRGFHFR